MGITLADILIAFRGDRTHVDRIQADLLRDLRRLGDQPVNVRIVGDSSGLQQGLTRTQEQVRRAGEGIHGVLAGAFSYVIGGVITAGLHAVAGGIKGIADGMVGGNAAFEDYQVRFTTLLKSTELAKQRMGELATFAVNTPFDLPQVVQADLVLQGFGFHAADVATKFGYSGEQIRTIVGDVASGTGQNFEEIASLFGRFSTGMVGHALMRFGELGAVNRDQLAAMGVQFNKAGELISDKSKAMAAILTFLQGKYGGLMEAQAMTLNGILSGLRDWFGETARIVGQPLFEGLRTSFWMLLQALKSPEAQAGIQALAQGMARLVSHVGSVISALLPMGAMIAGIFGPLVQLGAEWGSGFIGAFADGISMATGLVGDALGGLASMITGLLMPHSPPKILPDLDAWGTQTAQVWMEGWKQADFSLFESIGGSIKTALENAVGSGKMGEARVIPMLAKAKAELAKLISDRNANGGLFDESILLKIKELAGPAGQAVYDIADAFLTVDRRSKQLEQTQRDLNETTQRYDAILSPLTAQMAQLDAQTAAINDKKRLAEIQTQMKTATGSDKELLQIEQRRIALRAQIQTQTSAKDTAEKAAQARVTAAQRESDAATQNLAVMQAKQKTESESVAMVKEQVTLLTKLATAAGTAGGAMGGMAKSQGEINAAVQAARAKAKELKDQYDGLVATMTAMRDQGAAWVKPITDGLKEVQRGWAVLTSGVKEGGLRQLVSNFLILIGQFPAFFSPLVQQVLAFTDTIPARIQSIVALFGGFATKLRTFGTTVVFPVLIAELSDLAFYALQAANWMGNLAVSLGPQLLAAGTAALSVLRGIVTTIQAAWTNGLAVFQDGGHIGAAITAFYTTLWTHLAAGLPDLIASGKKLAGGLVEGLTKHLPEGLRTKLPLILGAITGIFTGVSLAPALGGMFAGLSGIAGPVVAALAPVGAVLSTVFAPFGAVLGWLTPSLGGLGAAFLTLLNPMNLLHGGMALLAPIIELVGQGFLGLHMIGGLLFTGLGSIAAGLGGIFANVGITLALLIQRIPSLGTIVTRIGPTLLSLVTKLGPTLLNLGKTVLGLFSPLGIAITLIGLFAGAWATNFGGIRQIVEKTLGPVMPLLSGLATLFQLVLGQLLQGNWSGAFSLLQQGFRELGPLLGTVATSFQTGLPMIFGVLMDFLGGLLTTVIGLIGTYLPKIIEAVAGIAFAFVAWIGPMIPPMLMSIGNLLTTVLTAIGAALPGIVEKIAQIAAAFLDWIVPMLPKLVLGLLAIIVGISTWILQQVPIIAEKLGEWSVSFVNWCGEMLPKLMAALGTIIAGILLWIVTAAPGILKGLVEWTAQFTVWVEKQALPALLGALGKMFTGLWTELKTAWNNAFADGSLGASLIAGLKKGISDGWSTFSGWFVTKLTDMIPDWAKGPLGIGSEAATAPAPDLTGADVPVYASGTTNHPGGLALVGEHGPELVNLPRGSAVTPADRTARMARSPLALAVNSPLAGLDAAMAGDTRRLTGLGRLGASAPAQAPTIHITLNNPVVDTDARLEQIYRAIEQAVSASVDRLVQSA